MLTFTDLTGNPLWQDALHAVEIKTKKLDVKVTKHVASINKQLEAGQIQTLQKRLQSWQIQKQE